MSQLTQRPAWAALAAHYQAIRDTPLRDLFAADPGRAGRMACEAAAVFLDYSKNRATAETLDLLLKLADETGLRGKIDAMFRGDADQHDRRAGPCCTRRSARPEGRLDPR